MAVPIHSLRDFQKNLHVLDSDLLPNLYGFLLFDERPSHEIIERFAERELKWLDDLARSAQIILFVYVAKPQGRLAKRKRTLKVKSGDQLREELVNLIVTKDEIKNPSLEVAQQMLGIKPEHLPGIAFFDKLQLDKGKKGIFFPLKTELFENNAELERVFYELFGVIRRCQLLTSSAEELYENIREELKSVERDEQLRPALAYLKSSFVTMITVTLPIAVEAFAEATIKQFTG